MYTPDLGSLPTGPREASPARLRGQGHPPPTAFLGTALVLALALGDEG